MAGTKGTLLSYTHTVKKDLFSIQERNTHPLLRREEDRLTWRWFNCVEVTVCFIVPDRAFSNWIFSERERERERERELENVILKDNSVRSIWT